jgi:hypothetical protein
MPGLDDFDPESYVPARTARKPGRAGLDDFDPAAYRIPARPISHQASERLTRIRSTPVPETSGPSISDQANQNIDLVAGLPQRVYEAEIGSSQEDQGTSPLYKFGRRALAGAERGAVGLATLPYGVAASVRDRMRREGVLKGGLRAAAEIPQEFTGVPDIARQVREGSLGKEFLQDPTAALMPYAMAAGAAGGAMEGLRPKALVEGLPEPRMPSEATQAVQEYLAPLEADVQRELAPAPSVIPPTPELGGEQVIARNLPGPETTATIPAEILRQPENVPRETPPETPLALKPGPVAPEESRFGEAAVERRQTFQMPPGSQDLEFTDTGEIKPGPLKGRDLIWPDRGELQSGRFEGQAPGPAGSVMIKVRTSDGESKYFQVREGENRVLVAPREEPAEPSATEAGSVAEAQRTAEANLAEAKKLTPSLAQRREAGAAAAKSVFPDSPLLQSGMAEALEAAGGRLAANSHEARVEEAAKVLGMTEEEKAAFAGDDVVGTAYATSIGAPPNHPAPASFAQELGDRLRASHATSPQLYELRGTPIGASAVQVAAARDATSGLAALAWEDMRKVLKTREQQTAFARFLNSEAAKAIMEDPERAGNVRIPILTGEERAKIPQAAIDMWRSKVQPVIESYREPAGIKGKRETESGVYSKLHAVEPDESLPWDLPVEKAPEPGVGGKARPFQSYRFGRAKAAMKATGAGEYYSVDLKDIIEHTLKDRVARAAQNDLLKTVQSYEVKPDEMGNLPKTVPFSFAGERTRQVRVVPVDLGRFFPMQFAEHGEFPALPEIETGKVMVRRPVYPTLTVKTVMVPEPVRAAMNTVLNPPKEFNVPFVTAFSRIATSTALASFAEGLGHSYVVMRNLWNAPGIGRSLGGPGKFIARLGPVGRIPMMVADAVNVAGESARADYISGFKHGGFRASQLAGQEHGGLTSIFEKVPGLKQMKEAIFGLGGMEMKARVALYRCVKEAKPGIKDDAAWALVNNQLGTYVRDLQPTLVRWLRGSGIDPFAAAGVASIKTGLKSLAGRGPHGFSPEVWWNSLVAPAITLYLVSKAVDKQHRDPWDVPGFKPGNVLIYQDERKTVWINASNFMGPGTMGIRSLGITSVLSRIAKGSANTDDLIRAWVTGIANTGMARFSPAIRAGFAATTGTAPYLTSRGDLLRLTPKSQTRQVALNMKEAAKQLSPFGLKAIPGEAELTPDTVPGKVAYFLARLTATPVSIRGPEKEFASGPDRSGASQAYEVARDIAFSAGNITDPEKRDAYVEHRIETDIKPEYRDKAGDIARRMVRGPKVKTLSEALRQRKARTRRIGVR